MSIRERQGAGKKRALTCLGVSERASQDKGEESVKAQPISKFTVGPTYPLGVEESQGQKDFGIK